MIKTPLSTVIGGAFWTPKATILGGTSKTFDQLIKSLFANNEQGFFFDPNDISTLFQDAAGTVPVTGAGQAVGLILDKSGRNNHARQTNAASRPILRQNAVTGANYLEFDGSDDFLVASSIDFTATDKISLFAGVRKLSDFPAFPLIVETGNSATVLGSFHLYANASTTQRGYAFAATGATQVWRSMAGDYASPDSAVITAFPNLSAAGGLAVKLRRNGVNQTLVDGAGDVTGGGNFGNLPLYIGRRAGTSLPFNGHIYSLIGVGRITTDIETTAIEKELAKRVGVTLSV